MQIIKDLVKVNPYTRPARKNYGIKGIVMHYTATPGATAKNERDYFNGTCIAQKRYASAHYFVDKNEVRQIIPDNEVAYHAHDHSRCYISALGDNANFTALGVEMCIEKDGSLHPDTVRFAKILVAYLCQKYNLPTSRIYRHYDVTGKNCPAMWVTNPSQFTTFKSEVGAIIGGVSPAPSTHTDEVVHTVVKGDTLWGIAQTHGTTVAKLKELNPKLDDILSIGEKITVKEVQSEGSQASSGYTIPTGIIKKGDKGTQVRNLQTCLNLASFKLKGNVDGIFGDDTLQALTRFQKVYTPYGVDGIYGSNTEAALRKVLK